MRLVASIGNSDRINAFFIACGLGGSACGPYLLSIGNATADIASSVQYIRLNARANLARGNDVHLRRVYSVHPPCYVLVPGLGAKYV